MFTWFQRLNLLSEVSWWRKSVICLARMFVLLWYRQLWGAVGGGWEPRRQEKGRDGKWDTQAGGSQEKLEKIT